MSNTAWQLPVQSMFKKVSSETDFIFKTLTVQAFCNFGNHRTKRSTLLTTAARSSGQQATNKLGHSFVPDPFQTLAHYTL